MPSINLSSLIKKYGDVQVLHDINLDMKDGEFTVLVGPSGCGKSTTLRMIAGLEELSGGEIYIDGKPISKLEPKDRGLAMVFQDYALYPHMNVADNMSFALRLQGVPKASRYAKVLKVAKTLGLEPYLNRKPADLSGGQRQRVAMGRALVRDVDVFLFDEPLSNLDAKLRAEMRAELSLMRQRVQKNMIYVTHDQVEAMTLADRIVVMNDGYIQQQGSPEELYKKPANKFVAGFLGTPSMNFLNAKLRYSGIDVFIDGEGFSIKLSEEKAKKIAKRCEHNVIFGVRPSDLIYNPKAKDDRSFDVRVVVSEYIGSQSVLIVEIVNDSSNVGQRLNVELKSETPIPIGKVLRFEVLQGSTHLFDSTTEKAIF